MNLDVRPVERWCPTCLRGIIVAPSVKHCTNPDCGDALQDAESVVYTHIHPAPEWNLVVVCDLCTRYVDSFVPDANWFAAGKRAYVAHVAPHGSLLNCALRFREVRP